MTNYRLKAWYGENEVMNFPFEAADDDRARIVAGGIVAQLEAAMEGVGWKFRVSRETLLKFS